MTTAPPTLSQRRRSQTRQEIHRTAVDLVLERGLANVTVDDIAAAAGVSPRTFFNYFPTKRDALVWEPPPLPEEALARFLAGTGRLRDELRDLLVAYVDGPRASVVTCGASTRWCAPTRSCRRWRRSGSADSRRRSPRSWLADWARSG